MPKGKEMGSDADIMTQAVITMVNKCLICSLRFIFFVLVSKVIFMLHTILWRTSDCAKTNIPQTRAQATFPWNEYRDLSFLVPTFMGVGGASLTV